MACFPSPLLGSRARLEHVWHARGSAAHAARSILRDDPSPYDPTPFFFSSEEVDATATWPFNWVMHGSPAGEAVVVGADEPVAACFWCASAASSDAGGEGGAPLRVVAVLLESGDEAQNSVLRTIARNKPVVDAAALRACGSAGEALRLVAAAAGAAPPHGQ